MKVITICNESMYVNSGSEFFQAEILKSESSQNMKCFENHKNFLCKFSVSYDQNEIL